MLALINLPILTDFLLKNFILNKPSAYLDPGSGSYILQLIVAGVFGALFLLKLYWRKVIGFFSKGEESPEDQDQQNNDRE